MTSEAAADQGWRDDPLPALRASLDEALEERVDVHAMVAEIKATIAAAKIKAANARGGLVDGK